MIKRLRKWEKYFIAAWVLTSVILIVCTALFRINDYIAQPQHGIYDNLREINTIIFSKENASHVIWFHLFFIFDFIWVFFLIMGIASIIRKILDETIFQFSIKVIYFVFGIVLLLAEFLEAMDYEFIEANSVIGLQTIFYMKLFAYIGCLIFLVYWFLKYHLLPNVKNIIRFIQTSLLSLLFILIVYAMITVMPQGGTIVVDLFYNPLNIILFFFLLIFLSLLLSHFPVYIDIWLYGDSDCVDLKISEKHFNWRGFGIIYYSTENAKKPLLEKKKDETENKSTSFDQGTEEIDSAQKISNNADNEVKLKGKNDENLILSEKNGKNLDANHRNFSNETVKMLRRSLGVLIYGAVFNIFLGVVPRYFEAYFSTTKITLLLLLVTYIIYYFLGKRYNNWKKTLKDSDVNEQKKVVRKIMVYVSFFPKYFVICTGLVLVTTLLSFVYGWSRLSLIFLLCTLGCQMFLYIYFKICRSYFKYVFYSEALEGYNKIMYDQNVLDLFKKHGGFAINRKLPWYLTKFGKLSDNSNYLNFMRWSGIVAVGIMLAANISFTVASFLNPINIIILYIILFYSAIILLWKHMLYYNRIMPPKEDNIKIVETKKKNIKYIGLFKYVIPIVLIAIIGWNIQSISRENDLHELSLVERQKTVSYKDYMEGMTVASEKEKENYFFVGSYGGGLKANLWNLMLLNKLNDLSGSQFLERTMVMSGVSGGAVGIGNYTSLLANYAPEENLDDAIFDIGKSNVLSNELVYFLGWDWVRENIPGNFYNGKDRSYKSMKLHAKNTGMEKSLYNKVSYADYWYKAYQKKNKKFPVLIMNSTSVAGKQGIVSTVQFPDSTFAGADNLSTVFDTKSGTDRSLTYFGAVSTTNRFPIFSPTAKIPGKGNYLDGGYFDNSGMLSALEVYDAIERDSIYKKKVNPIFINIINSKDFYISQKIIEWGFETGDVKESGEVASIIETVISIDKLPRYVYEKIKNRGFTIMPIMMPHKLSYENVTGVLKAKVKTPLALMDSIKKHNAVIDKALKDYINYNYEQWGVVEPPLARILGQPSVRYQEAMICCHPDVTNALERVLVFIATDTVVTNKNQNKLHRSVSKYKTKDDLPFKKSKNDSL